MKISIGILAYNEEKGIRRTLEGLHAQTLLQTAAARGREVEVMVVVNGTKDRTAAIASDYLAAPAARLAGVAGKVKDIPEPGKSNAWNRYVHEFSDPATDLFILLDADIQFGQPECLAWVVEALEANPRAVVSVDVPLKDIAARANLSAREKLSLSASELQRAGPPKLAGSLYCARAAALRGIWMPDGLLVEDGYLKASLLTRNFREPEDLGLIVRADAATHYFEAVTDLPRWYQHERRLFMGTVMNIVLFDFIRGRVAAGEDALALVRRMNQQDPKWLAGLVRERLERGENVEGGREWILLPFRQLRNVSGLRRLKHLPNAILRAALNAVVVTSGYRLLKSGRGAW